MQVSQKAAFQAEEGELANRWADQVAGLEADLVAAENVSHAMPVDGAQEADQDRTKNAPASNQ